jgi:hypothetical protein
MIVAINGISSTNAFAMSNNQLMIVKLEPMSPEYLASVIEVTEPIYQQGSNPTELFHSIYYFGLISEMSN